MKKKKDINRYIRAGIQLLFFLFLPGAFNAAFAGIKYIFTQIGQGQLIEMSSLVSVLVVLCIYTIVFGRFFCGFACAFGGLGDGLRALYVFICKKLKKKPISMNRKLAAGLSFVKYGVLIAILVMCFTGVYSVTNGCSPWDVFSMLHSFNFKLNKYIVGLVILVFIMVGMCLEERFFCKFICPMGAIFSLLPVLPFFALVRDRDNCIPNCKACTNKCPSDIGLPATGQFEIKGDCFSCQKCIGTCPKGNIHTGIKALKGNEIWFTLLRAGILAGLLIWLGI